MHTLETTWKDAALRMIGVRHWPSHVILVTVDEPALARFHDDPLAFWTPHFAQATQRLREMGAKVVGVDFLLGISPENWLAKMGVKQAAKTWDAGFREQVGSGQVVLVASWAPNSSTALDDILLPDAGFLMSVPDLDFPGHIGLANLSPDDDGVIRNFRVAPELNLPPDVDATQLPRISFAPLLAMKASGSVTAVSGAYRDIAWSGPPGTIPRISLAKVLDADGTDDALRTEVSGKVVIIGGDFFGMGDAHATPYGDRLAGTGTPAMIGPEIQANIVEQLLAGLAHKRFSMTVHWASVIVLAMMGALLGWRATQGHALIALGMLCVVVSGILAFSVWAMSRFFVLETFQLVAAVTISFLLVSLRGMTGTFKLSEFERESFPVAILAVSFEEEAERGFQEVSNLIKERGGTASSGEGHLVLGYFGWPTPTANSCHDAFSASILIGDRLRDAGIQKWGVAITAGETVFFWRRGLISAFGEAVGKAADMARAVRKPDGGLWVQESIKGGSER